MSFDAGRTTGDTGRILAFVAGWLGLAAMLVLAPFFLASGLLAPLWGVVLIMLIWAGFLAAGIVLLVRRHPLWVLPIPVIAVGVWWLVMSLGEHLLGWTA